jgi:hypothetical protein
MRNRLSRRLPAALAAGVIAVLALAGSASAGNDQGGHGERIFGAHLKGALEVPGPGEADAEGWAWVNVNEKQRKVCWVITQASGSEGATAAHIHLGGPGVAGPILFALTPPVGGSSEGCTGGLDRQFLRDILDHPGDYYVNVHTTKHPAGAMRGQLEWPAPDLP